MSQKHQQLPKIETSSVFSDMAEFIMNCDVSDPIQRIRLTHNRDGLKALLDKHEQTAKLLANDTHHMMSAGKKEIQQIHTKIKDMIPVCIAVVAADIVSAFLLTSRIVKDSPNLSWPSIVLGNMAVIATTVMVAGVVVAHKFQRVTATHGQILPATHASAEGTVSYLDEVRSLYHLAIEKLAENQPTSAKSSPEKPPDQWLRRAPTYPRLAEFTSG